MKYVSQPLPPEILIEETIKELGHNPYLLKPWSRKRVLVKCFITGKISNPTRASLNLNKSIKETGHFISKSGLKNRKGKITSIETKIKQSISHKARWDKLKEVA